MRNWIPGPDERWFERFRRHGDSAALARVFDRTAPELFGLAARLAPAPGLAQDLLQQTFLRAIENAASFDSRRRLAPWLVGILVREARLMRRRERRAPDPERLGRPASEDPAQAAEADDFARALRGALESLPAKYRAVLEPFLWEEQGASEIARALGRTDGTVRVQIHRGLALLRKALPASFALAGARGAVSAQALAEVRARVLGTATGTAAVPASAAPGAFLGGFMVQKWVLAATVLIVGGVWWWSRGAGTRGGEARPSVSAAAQADADPAPLAPPRAEHDSVREPVVATLAGRETEAPAELRAAPALTGRVLELDGRPVPDFAVALIEIAGEFLALDESVLLDSPPSPTSSSAQAGPELVRARTRTDAEGRFRLEPGTGHGLRALVLDLGGRRASLCLVDEALHAGASAELGDVVLAPSVALGGRVLDARGAPVAGVRVRALDAQLERFLAHDLHALRATSRLALAQRGAPPQLLSVPAWILDLCELLPVPTARTDADGRFTLEAPREHDLLLCLDEPRFAPRAQPLRLSAAADLGALVLADAAALACSVVDAQGAPVPDAEVVAGSPAPGGKLTLCEPARHVGAGRYEGHGRMGAGAAFFARRGAGAAWTACVGARAGALAKIVLPAEPTLRLEVVDAEGRAVEGLALALRPEGESTLNPELSFLATWHTVTARLQRLGPTSYALPCGEGRWQVLAHADGCAPTRAELVVEGAQPRARLVLAPERAVRVRVVEAGSRAPLAGARVSLRAGRQGRFVRQARATTDADGRAVLPRAVLAEREERHVQAELEGYAVAGTTLPDDGPDECELVLARPASLAGRVLAGGRAPDRRHLVVLQPLATELRSPGNLPWHALTDAEGRFHVSGLPPGPAVYNVGERILTAEPFTGLVLGELFEAFDADKGLLERRVAMGVLELDAGETTELRIELEEPGSERPARLTGRLVKDGRGFEGIQLELHGEDSRQKLLCTTARDGGFDFGAVQPGRVKLKAEDRRNDRTLLRLALALAPDEARVLELPFDPFAVDFAVARAGSGTPLTGVELTLVPSSRLYGSDPIRARTDSAGRCRVTLPGCGSYAWSAELGAERCTGALDVGSDLRYALAFRAMVAFAGRVELEPGMRGDGPTWMLQLTPSETDAGARPLFAMVREERPTFEFASLPPGRYEAELLLGRTRCRPLAIEVPAGGLTDQHLVFAAE